MASQEWITCSLKTSSDGTLCQNKCPANEIFSLGATSCSKCPLNQVPNLNQDNCVSKSSCYPGFLNLAGTYCITSCSSESAFYNVNNQCVTCQSLDSLSLFVIDSCKCIFGASKSTPSSPCSCNSGFVTQINACICSKKISSSGNVCQDKCPETEVSISNNVLCSVCTSQIPNVDQTACVDLTACQPGYLNLKQTFCIQDCASDKAGVGLYYQCATCLSINTLSIFKVSSCECLANAIGTGTSCTCNIANGFTGVDCSCSLKTSSDGTLCQNKCPANEIFSLGATSCSKCPLNQVPNLNQDNCIIDQKCNATQFDYLGECYMQCPQGTITNRAKICIKDCKIYDVYPNPIFCEILGSSQCTNIRAVQLGVFVCTKCKSNEFYNGLECTSNCQGQFVKFDNKSQCSTSCGAFPKGYTEEYFNQVAVFVCHNECPPDYPEYSSNMFKDTQQCFAPLCQSNQYLETNNRCVSQCASKMYIINSSSSLNKLQCIFDNQTCNKYYLNNGMKECYNQCPLQYPFQQINQCLTSCTPYMNDPKSVTHKICLQYCGGNNPSYIQLDSNGRTQCINSCGDMFALEIGNIFECVQICEYYTWNGQSKICTSTCDYYRIDLTKDSVAKQCGDSCSQFNMTYMLMENGKTQCLNKCPDNYPFLDGIICKKYCKYLEEQQLQDISKYACVQECQSYYIQYPSNSMIMICKQNCKGNTPYVFKQQCVISCLQTEYKFIGEDGLTCVENCSGEYAKNINSMYCDISCDFYINSGFKVCYFGELTHQYRQIYKQINMDGIITSRYQFVDKCFNNEYLLVGTIKTCSSCILYELDEDAHKCVSNCSSSQVRFGNQCFTGYCKDIIGINAFIYTGVDKICSISCGNLFLLNEQTKQCTESCPTDFVYKEKNQLQICIQFCGSDEFIVLDSRYAVNGIGKCVKQCPIGQFVELLQIGKQNQFCVKQCANKQYIDQFNQFICVNTCEIYELQVNGDKLCVNNCQNSYKNKIQVIFSVDRIQCVENCPQSHPFITNDNLECVKVCQSSLYSYIDGIRKCTDYCNKNQTTENSFYILNHYMCIDQCDSQQLFVRTSGVIGYCVLTCPIQKLFYDINRECQSECNPQFYRTDGVHKQCMASCYSPYTRITLDGTYNQCNLICQIPKQYVLNNTCVDLCPIGTYLHDYICKISCPTSMKYTVYQAIGQYVCSNICPNNIFSKINGLQIYFCQNNCVTKIFKFDIQSGYNECLKQCDINDYLYSTGECSSNNCLNDPMNKFSLNKVCVYSCPDFVDPSDYSCQTTCSGSFSGFIWQENSLGQNMRICYYNCPTNFIDLRPSVQYCGVRANFDFNKCLCNNCA
ncbi:Conserved_hypothetical protein [Hexamita inflata]|uniref:Uncharacterized protein n=1 Tax=Hexamita inflata TaxID=28002 RepID=A0AA86RE01_9EUKA|nr:Conserved hypothetical protein [Hexamita inflata]CAI9974632.1 Conserved hypothetical protein [Hexamita inflata]